MSHRPEARLLPHLRTLYKSGHRAKKRELLNQVCETYGYHRKAAIRLLNGMERDPYGRRGRGRPCEYGSVQPALERLWVATDYMGSKKLKAAIPLWLPFYETHHGALSAPIKKCLATLSASTIDRLLKPLRVKYHRRGLAGTRPGSLLKHQIPIKTDHWDVREPGFMEADTVAHCGNTLLGDFIWSLTLTDIYSGWTEIRATWNKGAHGVVAAIKDIEHRLPFLLQGFDCDNGSEFLNYHLIHYLTHDRTKVIQFTRSRPYRKDDNAHVEQKNWTHVRQLMGYDRLDDQRLVELINDLYLHEWSFLQNYFSPNRKLLEKIKINSRYQKRYDKPQTAYQRLMQSTHILAEKKEVLKATFLQLDPFLLKQRLEQKLKLIFASVKVTPNRRQRI